MTLIIVMFILASLLIIAEVMFPSFGLLGFLAAGSFLVAILEAFNMGTSQGYVAIGAAVVIIPIAIGGGFFILKRTPLGNRLLLSAPEAEEVSGQGADLSLTAYVDQVGTALTPLRPSGTVEINDRTFSAVSNGEFIDRDTLVRVIQVEGNRVVVTGSAEENNKRS